MSPLRLALGSLLLASTLAGCAAHGTTSTLPNPSAPAEVALDRAQVRAKLAARRASVIERFLAYREGRVYPSTTAAAASATSGSMTSATCAPRRR